MSPGEDVIAELLKDLQEGARELLRVLPSSDAEEPLLRLVRMREQLDGLTAVTVGRARHRRVTWNKISTILGISEDTTRHRYTDHHILRRVGRFARSGQQPTNLASFFTPTHTSPAPAPANNVTHSINNTPEPAAGSGGGPGGGGEDTEPALVIHTQSSSSAAYNRLAPILSMLIRTAQLSNKEVSAKIGCSASYLSRILTGERVPTWSLTRKFARVCGADPEVLRSVWESQKLSQNDRDATVDDENPMPAAKRLRTAVETLHFKAGRPAPQDLAVASRWVLGITETARLLEGELLPDPEVLQVFVRLLGGDTNYFDRLLTDARQEAQQGSDCLQSETPQTTPCTDTSDPCRSGLDEVFKAFSPTFTGEHEVLEDGRARLLSRINKKAGSSGTSLTDRAALRRRLTGSRRGVLPSDIRPHPWSTWI
ncbi:helix-turn-helix domain-containing protein [Streptomyces sp. NPDC056488]|uniref:helix-turn-helix domain-containing protein n=1 Tax=Streptomyces sp. NPDC056488 TaxID=3345836 RepID=UPI0036821340